MLLQDTPLLAGSCGVPYLPMLAEEALEVSRTCAGGEAADPQVPSRATAGTPWREEVISGTEAKAARLPVPCLCKSMEVRGLPQITVHLVF